MKARGCLLLGMVALAGCAHRPVAIATPTPDWHRSVTANDRDRLRRWRTAFADGLAAARRSGNAAKIASEGALLDPDAAIAGATLAAGTYRCRVIKLGAQLGGMLDYVAYPTFDCTVRGEGTRARFTKTGGSQRPTGMIFAESALRSIFIGTLMLGDETRAFDYGHDATRDMIGAVERIGPRRWRMLLPYPRFESLIDVVEIVPADG